jgi:hypothetical protein
VPPNSAATPTPTAKPADNPLPTSPPSHDPGPTSDPTPQPTATPDATPSSPAEGPEPGSSPSSASDGTAGGGQPGGPSDGRSGGDGSVASLTGAHADTKAGSTVSKGLGGAVESTTSLPASEAHGGPRDFFSALVSGVADRIGPTVQPAAVAAVATAFGFPLALMLAVLLFLVIESRLDGRDPKLRSAPLTSADTIMPFANEVDL